MIDNNDFGPLQYERIRRATKGLLAMLPDDRREALARSGRFDVDLDDAEDDMILITVNGVPLGHIGAGWLFSEDDGNIRDALIRGIPFEVPDDLSELDDDSRP